VKVRITKALDIIRASYWFIPSVMTVGAVILAVVVTTVDLRIGSDWLEAVSWLNANQPDGARSLLSTVSGSMIGIAGVTFSITMVAMVMAASQFGPRLLSNFMRDRGNQITLGIFIATFVYGVMVLRTVQSADLGGQATSKVDPFVPHLAVLIAIALAVVSLGAFIYFIHHAAESINVSRVVAQVGRDFAQAIDRVYPESMGEPGGGDPHTREAILGADFYDNCVEIFADGTGYVQGVDTDGLLDLATSNDLFFRVAYRPGDFVSQGHALVLAAPASRVDEGVCDRVRSSFAWGSERSRAQDIYFHSDQLAEIATRALSSGINDPRTAMMCMDWLGAGLERAASRSQPHPVRLDSDGAPRIATFPVTFEHLTDHVFDSLRPYVSGDRNAALYALDVLGRLATGLSEEGSRLPLRRQLSALDDAVALSISDPRDSELFRERLDRVRQVLRSSGDARSQVARLPWLGGSA